MADISSSNLLVWIVSFMLGALSVYLFNEYNKKYHKDSKSDQTRPYCILSHNDTDIARIESRGPNLDIIAVNLNFIRMIHPQRSRGQDPAVHELPRSVHDLFPADFAVVHKQRLSRVFLNGGLPSALIHPLRNVELMRLDGSTIQVDVKIGVVDATKTFSPTETTFFANITEHTGYSSW
jgi:hypothetical protein